MQQENIKITKLKNNTGQIVGLPKNPRKISSFKKDELKRSIVNAPEMLEFKCLLVYPFEDNYIVIAGNQRLIVCKDLKYKELPCFVLPIETTVEKLKEYSAKDNNHSGSWDWQALNAEWDIDLLANWGIYETTPSIEKGEKTESVNFQASKDLVITVKFDTEAQRELLYEKLQKEGFECWYGKRKPKN